MRVAPLAVLAAALTLLIPTAARAATWTAAASIATCAPASDPQVVFPFSLPSTRSGRGAILWLGGPPSCSGTPQAATSTLDSVTLHSDDQPSVPRVLVSHPSLVGPLASAGTTAGQLVAVAGDSARAAGGVPDAVLAEGVAGAPLPVLIPLDAPDTLVATADGYIGDADVVVTATALSGDQLIELREQRHYEHRFGSPVLLHEGFAPITALAVAMDFRGDSVILWAQGGLVHAQWVTNSGDVYAAQVLGPAGYAPQLAAVLSDNDHAFVMWSDEPSPGRPGEARIFLEHSANDVVFPPAPHLLVAFAEPAAQRLTAGSLALARITPSEGVLAAWTVMVDGTFEVRAAGLTASKVLPPATIAQAGVDLRLAALATGPRDDYVAVLASAPRDAAGFDTTQQAILAASSVPGGPGGVAFGPPAELAPPASNVAPTVALDPDTNRAVVAWQTSVAGVATVDYSVRTATRPAAAATRVAPADRVFISYPPNG
jgi:hypothetical protein